MAIIPRFRESGSPRVIGASFGASGPVEAAFFATAALLGRIVSPGAYVLILFSETQSAALYRRTRVEVPEDDDEAMAADGSTFFTFYREIVSPTNGRYLGSIVSVGAMFDPNTGIPESPWLRVVSIASLGAEGATFGLAELA